MMMKILPYFHNKAKFLYCYRNNTVSMQKTGKLKPELTLKKKIIFKLLFTNTKCVVYYFCNREMAPDA